MTTGNNIRYEKLKCNINKEAAKILALSSSKVDQYDYLTSEEILPFNQSQMIEQAKSTYNFQKTNKNNRRLEKRNKQRLQSI